MTKPRETVLELKKFNEEPDDNYYAKIKFKDPETGEKLQTNEVAIFRKDSTEIENLLFQDNTITTTTSGTDLTISSQGSPFVKIDSTLKMPVQDDSAVVASSATHIALYGKDPDKGKSGVWFKNKYNHEDELISTNRSLLYSMLF